MKNEKWVSVKDYEGLYDVSNFGRVRSFDKTIPSGSPHGRFLPGRILKPCKGKSGYLLVSLYKDGDSSSHNIHQLVANAFLGSCPKGQIVRHKQNNRANNSAANLRYGTPKQNTDDRIKHGTMRYGENVHNAKLSNSDVYEIRATHKFRCSINGTMAQAHKYGVSPSTISAIISGQNWKTIKVIAHERQNHP